MTREQQLENALLSLASHGRVLLSFAAAGLLTPTVITSSEALFAAAAELAVSKDLDEPPAPALVACEHPADQRIDFGGMGEAVSFQCRACGAQVDTTTRLEAGAL